MNFDELYTLVKSDGELQKAFGLALKNETVAEFLKEHGCEGTPGELDEYLKKRRTELGDDELDAVAGGTCDTGEPRRPRPIIFNRDDEEKGSVI